MLHRNCRGRWTLSSAGWTCSAVVIVGGKVCLDLVNAPSSMPAYVPLRCAGTSTTAKPEVFSGAHTRDGAPPDDEGGAQPLEHVDHDGGVPLQLPPPDRGHIAVRGATTGRSLERGLAVRLSNRSTQVIEPPQRVFTSGNLTAAAAPHARSPVPLSREKPSRQRRNAAFERAGRRGSRDQPSPVRGAPARLEGPFPNQTCCV